LPFLERTALESPAFAVIILLGVISTTFAVHPQPKATWPPPYVPSDFFLRSASYY